MPRKPLPKQAAPDSGVESDFKKMLAVAAVLAIVLVLVFMQLGKKAPVQPPPVQELPTPEPAVIVTAPPATPSPTKKPTPTPAPPEPVLVEITDFAFRPNNVSIKAGGLVVWRNLDTILYTVTSEDKELNSLTLGRGMEYNHSFSKAGAWKYYDTLHPGPVGWVYVSN